MLTEARREAVAGEALRERGAIVFCPTMRVRQRVRVRGTRNAHRVIDTHQPMFPRYVFAESDDAWSLRRAKGVCALLTVGGEPARIPDVVIDELRERADEAVNEPESGFIGRVGDRARLEGALHGFIGQIRALLPGGKARIELDRIFGSGREISVTIQSIGEIARDGGRWTAATVG